MKEQELLEKVFNLLIKKGFKIKKEDLIYNGVRDNSPMFDKKETKPMHIVSFSVETIKDNPFTSSINNVAIDVKTEKIEYIVGDSIFEKIEE